MTDEVKAHPLLRLLRYGRRFRVRSLLASLCSVLNKVFDLAPPLLIGAAVDTLVEGERSLLAGFGFESPMTQLIVIAVLTLLVWGLESLFEYGYAVLWRNLAQSLQHALRVDGYAHVQGLEMAWFEDRSTGGLMAILNDDVNQLERFLDGGANDILQVTTIAPGVALLSFLPVPLILWGSFLFQKRIAPRYALVRDRVGALNGLLNNNLGGIATIKSFTAESHEVARVAAQSEAYQASNRAAIRLSSAFSPLIRMVIVVGFTATLVYGGWLVTEETLAVGAYSVMVFLTQRLLWPLTRLGSTFDLYQRAMASTTRVLNLLDTRPQIVSGDGKLPAEEVEGALRFEELSFAYHPEIPILRSLDLALPAGRTTAVVGATGSGKSTLVKLLLRFYDPVGGRITIDGKDIRGLRLEDLRRAIGLVSQDVFLFHGTVRENIAYGRPDASAEEIEAAARAAEAHDFIVQLKDGYETVVGERGQKLSGGQRQRISLARAVLKDPPVLVLDEATSAVDNETEAAIQRSLTRVSQGRTTLVIAHRLSTVRHADTIHVLAGGELCESGHHQELLARDGVYAALWSVQTGEGAPPVGAPASAADARRADA